MAFYLTKYSIKIYSVILIIMWFFLNVIIRQEGKELEFFVIVQFGIFIVVLIIYHLRSWFKTVELLNMSIKKNGVR